MGAKIHFQAIPENCALFQLAKTSLLGGELLAGLPLLAEQESLNKVRELAEEFKRGAMGDIIEFVEEVNRTIQAYPGLENRHLDHDEDTWNQFCYLLSQMRNTPIEITKQGLMGDVMVYWNAYDISNLQSSIIRKPPVYYLPAAEVQKVHLQLATVTSDDLKKHYDIGAMIKAKVYKFSIDSSFDVIWGFFEQLRVFYAEASAHGEGVIATV